MAKMNHKDINIKISSATLLLPLVSMLSLHRYITKSDIRTLIAITNKNLRDPENTRLIAMVLKIVISLSETDEFMETFHIENFYRPLIKIVGDGVNEETDIDALHALHNILCSVYGRDIVANICKMQNNEGLRSLMRLLSPPTKSNVSR